MKEEDRNDPLFFVFVLSRDGQSEWAWTMDQDGEGDGEGSRYELPGD